MIRKSLAIAAAMTMTLASVAAHAQAPVRASAATVKPVAFSAAPVSATRTGANVSGNASELNGIPTALLLALIAAFGTAGYFIFKKESSPR